MKTKKSSIKTKLLMIILSLLLVSLGFVTGLSYYFSKQYLSKSVDETALAIGSDYANRIQAIQGEMLFRLQEISATQRFRSGTDKEFIVFTMNEAFNRIGKFDVMTFISMDGTGTRFDGSTINLSSRQFFKDAVNTQKPLISEPVVASATGKLSVQVVTPVFDNGKMTGVMTGTVSLANLSSLISEVKFKDSGYGVICDDSGLIIANGKNPELVGKLSIKDKKINSELKLGIDELDERLVTLFKQAAETGKQTRGEYTFVDGVNYVGVLTPINLPGEHRWVMMVNVPEVEANQETRTLTQIMLVVSLICIAFGVLVVVYISKKIAKPIITIRDEALLLAKGDLRSRYIDIEVEDETGQLVNAFKEMAKKLRVLIGKVQSQAISVAASSEELTASAQQSADVVNQVAESIVQISQRADQQADAVTSMVTVVEKMSVSIEQVAASGKLVAEIANGTSKSTVEGCQAIDQAMMQMKQIGQGSDAVQKVIGELVKGSNEISEIVNLIASIAGQTNLLALNAAIEAARAGEHGRGFAVVADEVRKLAEDSSQAAQKIANLIKKNETDMNEAIAVTEANNNGVNTGINVVQVAGNTFKRIADSVVQLSEQVNNISESIDQIAVGSQVFVESVQHIDMVSKENVGEFHIVSAATEEQSASMQEIASASQVLAKISGELQEGIVTFKI